MNLVEFASLEGAALSLVAGVALRRIDRISARTEQVDKAADLLRRHYDNLKMFLDDDGAPRVLAELLLSVSDAILNREAVTQAFLTTVPADDRHVRDVNDAWNAFETLRTTRPELAESFERAIRYALHASLLVDKRTAAHIDKMEREVVCGPQGEIAAATVLARAFA